MCCAHPVMHKGLVRFSTAFDSRDDSTSSFEGYMASLSLCVPSLHCRDFFSLSLYRDERCNALDAASKPFCAALLVASDVSFKRLCIHKPTSELTG